MRSSLSFCALVALVTISSACSNGTDVDPAAHCPVRAPVECATDVGGMLPARLDGATSLSGVGAFDGSRCGNRGGEAIDDVGFEWTAPHAGRFRISTEGSAFDTILSVREGCGGREITCNDDGGAMGTVHSVVSMDLEDCQTITIVIDGFDGSAAGDYRLSIDAVEASCSDGTDDDHDGLADCDDPDCAGPRCDVPGDWPPDWVDLEEGVIEAVNRVRAEGATCGGMPMPPVGPLERDELLELAARGHSQDMLDQDYFDHTGLDGRSPFDRIADAGFTGPGPLGENIAAGYRTVEEVMNGWMNSPGHCTNIMNGAYRTIGVGYAENAGGNRWTQNFAGGH